MPLLSPSTIQAVRDLPIATVIGRHVTLKAKGQDLWGCCPFHNEKSSSFEVRVKTNSYHCFGCGEKGNGISFAMKSGGLDFVEAVEALATEHGIGLDYEATNLTPEQQAADEAKRQERKEITAVLEWATGWFASNRMVAATEPDAPATEAPAFAEFLTKRVLFDATVLQVGLGYAPTGGKTLLEAANRAGYLAPVLVQASLLREVKKDDRTTYYDFFQDRAMFPIRDARGLCVGFVGRYIGPELPPEKKDMVPKAINSADVSWTKGAHLYGLDRAGAAIRKANTAFLVEGQMDVLQMWQHGLDNTVGQGGTALTDEQIALLKRYTDQVVLVYDNDPAGRKATKANAPRLLAAGFHVAVLVPALSTDKGKADSDPDSFVLALCAAAAAEVKKERTKALDLKGNKVTAEAYKAHLVDEWVRSRQDYITHFALPEAMADADLGVRERANAITTLAELVESLPSQPERVAYYDEVAGLWPAFKKTYKLAKRKAEPALEVQKETKEALQRMTAEEMTASMEEGFFQRHGGYWAFDTQKNRDVCICEFTIEFLFFVVSNSRPKYVCNLVNSFGRARLGTFSTDDFVSKDGFNKAIGRYHGFVFEGSQHHLNRIKIKRWAGCREAVEANYLGWNEKVQVYAWNNGLLQDGVFYPCDKYGVVTLRKPVASLEQLLALPHETQLEVDGTVPVLNSPAEIVPKLGEEAVVSLLETGKMVALNYQYLPSGGSIQLGSEESDELAKKFKHFGTGSLTFTDWAKLICTVHGTDNGRTMIAFYIAVLFRSIIHKANGGYFPILYHFGLKGSGKTQSSLSLMYMFGTPPHDDGIGLESGSTTTGMQRFLSSISDGLVWLNEYKNSLPVRTIGMLKDLAGGSGKMTGMNTSGNETKTTPPRSAALISGQDLPTVDPALLDRCIINEFDKREHQYEPYKQLSEIQTAGHTTAVTNYLLGYRAVVAAGYKKQEPKCTTELRLAGREIMGEEPNSRAVLNLTSVLTPCQLLMEAGVVFPFTYDELKATLVGKMTRTAAIQNVSDEVETFFLTLASLPVQACEENFHYKIEKDAAGRILLFLRTRVSHAEYQKALKAQGGTPMGVSALTSYMEKHRSFIEKVDNTRFNHEQVPNATSALVFDYRMLREQGIEFRTRVKLASAPLVVQEPAEEEEAPKITIDGNMTELVAAFLGNIAITEAQPRRKFRPKQLYDVFHADKANVVPSDDFVAALRLGEAMPTPNGLRTVLETWDGQDKGVAMSEAKQVFYTVMEGVMPF